MPDYRHLMEMTDHTGILQFSNRDIPDTSSGYTLDDNARALIAALEMEDGHDLAYRYASWMAQAQRSDGSWCNLQIYGRDYPALDSEDSKGRALLACCIGSGSQWEDVRSLCQVMLKHNLFRSHYFTSPRAAAYVLTGLCNLKSPLTREQHQLIRHHSQILTRSYRHNERARWHWFENILTYCNGILPQALFCVYQRTGDKKSLKIAHDSLNFLCDILFHQGYLSIIGNQGWYPKGQTPALFDQQPVDAASIAFACLEAYKSIGASEYLDLAEKAYQWYHGVNVHGLSLYDVNTGGCYDALTEDGVNLNQGAESLVSLLLIEQQITKHSMKAQPAMEQSS